MDITKAKKIVQSEIYKYLDKSIWKFKVVKSYHYLGTTTCYTDSATKQITSGLIRINELALIQNGLKVILNIVRHEVAHALDGNRNGHNKKFRAICTKLGTNDSLSCSDSIELRIHSKDVEKLKLADSLWELEGNYEWTRQAAMKSKR